jgi:hypothetical protein
VIGHIGPLGNIADVGFETLRILQEGLQESPNHISTDQVQPCPPEVPLSLDEYFWSLIEMDLLTRYAGIMEYGELDETSIRGTGLCHALRQKLRIL